MMPTVERRTDTAIKRCLSFRLACVALLCLGGTSFASAQPRRIVILYDERTDLPGLATLDASLVQSLARGSGTPLEVYRESMDLSRFGSPEYELVLRDHLRAKYAGKAIAVAIAAMGPALDFLLAYGGVVFPGAPIVFCGIDRRELGSRPLPRHATGVLVKRAFLPTLELALSLHPGVQRVVFVAGTSEFDARLVDQARQEFQALEGRFAFTYLTALPLDSLLAELARLPPRTVVLYSTMFRDGAGVAFVPHEVAGRIAAASNAPVYAFLDQYVGRGIVGGHVYSLEAHGHAAAELAVQVLSGKPPSELPLVEGGANLDMFDWRQLERWSIDESALPPGAIIRFRTPTVWHTYRRYIVATGIVVVLQTVLIAGLLIHRTRRRRAEERVRKSEAALRTSYERIRELAGRLISAQEEERARIARDLHDDIGQRVASFGMALGRLKRQIPDASGPAGQSLSDLQQQAAGLSADLRELSHDLHPSAVEHVGLLHALRARCDEFSRESGVRVRLDVSDTWRDVPGTVGLCLYRAAQEVLRNVATHAQARHVTVSLDRRNGQLTMRVSDDGLGFDPAAVSRRSGLGLVSLNERVRMLGGTLDVTAAPGAGTHIAVNLPTEEAHASQSPPR